MSLLDKTLSLFSFTQYRITDDLYVLHTHPPALVDIVPGAHLRGGWKTTSFLFVLAITCLFVATQWLFKAIMQRRGEALPGARFLSMINNAGL